MKQKILWDTLHDLQREKRKHINSDILLVVVKKIVDLSFVEMKIGL